MLWCGVVCGGVVFAQCSDNELVSSLYSADYGQCPMTPYREQGITALFTTTAAAANNNHNKVPHSADSACVKGHLLTLYPFCLSVHAASGGGRRGLSRCV